MKKKWILWVGISFIAIGVIIGASGIYALIPAGVILGAIYIGLYLLSKKKFLVINYSGGSFAVETKYFGTQEIETFSRKITSMRDLLKNQKTNDLIDCPYCAEPIKRKAIMCKHCGSTIT